MLGNLDLSFIKALRVIDRKLKGKNIDWVLVGSTSLALQGVEIQPKDIDLLTDEEGAYRIGELLREYEIEPVKFRESRLFKSFFGEYKILGVEVEVMGNLEERLRDRWLSLSGRLRTKRWVKVNEMKVPVSSLREQLKVYEKLGREKDVFRAKKIREAIVKQSLL